MTHSGSEYGIVLEGRLGATVGDPSYELGPSGSIAFRSTSPHRLWTIGEPPGDRDLDGRRPRRRPSRRRLKPALRRTKLKIRKGKRRAIRDLLLGGGKLNLRVTATATDAAGNAAPAQLVGKAKRPPGPLS